MTIMGRFVWAVTWIGWVALLAASCTPVLDSGEDGSEVPGGTVTSVDAGPWFISPECRSVAHEVLRCGSHRLDFAGTAERVHQHCCLATLCDELRYLSAVWDLCVAGEPGATSDEYNFTCSRLTAFEPDPDYFGVAVPGSLFTSLPAWSAYIWSVQLGSIVHSLIGAVSILTLYLFREHREDPMAMAACDDAILEERLTKARSIINASRHPVWSLEIVPHGGGTLGNTRHDRGMMRLEEHEHRCRGCQEGPGGWPMSPEPPLCASWGEY